MAETVTPLISRQIYQTVNENLGALCLTEEPTNLLMWAHYADHHRGTVIEFDSGHDFFDRKRGPNDDLRHFRKIAYTQTRPEVFLNGLNVNRLVTLFYLGNPMAVRSVVYDLTRDERTNPDGIEKIEVFSPGDCPLCKEGSSRIKMSRDHFVPERPGSESLLIKANDAPAWMRIFLERYRGPGTIRAHYGRGLRGFTHNIFLDVRRALETESDTHLKLRLNRLLTQSLPVSLSRIIHLGDPGSIAMAAIAQDLFGRFNDGRKVPLLAARAVVNASTDLIQTEGSTVVMASCIVGGRSLMELSQVLRTIQANGCIVFVVGVARFSSNSVLEEARSNLTYTGDRSTDFGFHAVDQICVPNNTANRPSSWDDEMDFLKQLQRIYSSDDELAPILRSRLDQLISAGSDTRCGLQDELFWPNVHGQALSLRPNFAFYRPMMGSDSLSQAEVFFAMSCTLHNLRQRAPAQRSLDQSEHHRTLIEPTTFYRLNDGVVQASLLRSARASEIDYRVDEVKSATMQEVIRSVLIECDKDRGEATIEFLLALAMQQLRLTPSDTKRLIASCETALAKYPMARCLCAYLKEHVI